MLIILPAPVAHAIANHAATSRPEECCGILVGATVDGHTRVAAAAPAANIAPEDQRRHRYAIDPRALLAAQQAEHPAARVVGYYHSHPDAAAVPSATDLADAWPEYVYLIVPVSAAGAGTARAWQLRDGALVELEVRAEP